MTGTDQDGELWPEYAGPWPERPELVCDDCGGVVRAGSRGPGGAAVRTLCWLCGPYHGPAGIKKLQLRLPIEGADMPTMNEDDPGPMVRVRIEMVMPRNVAEKLRQTFGPDVVPDAVSVRYDRPFELEDSGEQRLVLPKPRVMLVAVGEAPVAPGDLGPRRWLEFADEEVAG